MECWSAGLGDCTAETLSKQRFTKDIFTRSTQRGYAATKRNIDGTTKHTKSTKEEKYFVTVNSPPSKSWLIFNASRYSMTY